MTHFAVILDLEQEFSPVYLTALTYIGMWTSIFSLIITLCVNLYFAKLRSKITQQILINICICLLLLNIIFVIGIDKKDNEKECFTATIFLHYSVLCLWAWLFVEGLYLFRTLVYGRYVTTSPMNNSKFILIASSLCYGVPFIIVASIAGSMDKNLYQSEKYCWLHPDVVYGSVVIPVAIILFFNLTVFALVMYSITCGRTTFKPEFSMKELKVNFRRAIMMISVTGIPWMFGYFMLLSTDRSHKEVFAVLFTLFNTSQGVTIFFLYVVLQENIQKMIKAKFVNTIEPTYAKIKSSPFVRAARKSLGFRALLEETVSKNAKRHEARRSTLGDVVTLNSSVDFGTPSRSAKTSIDFGTPVKTTSTSVDYGTPAQYGSMQNEVNQPNDPKKVSKPYRPWVR